MSTQKLLKKAARCWKEGDKKGTIKAYKRIISIEPNHYRALNNLASIEFIAKNYAAAEALLKQAVKVEPDLSEAHINLGNIYSMTEQLDLAIKTFTDVIRIEPNSYIAYHQLGLNYLKLKELNDALNAINMSISINPGNAGLFILLGQILEAKDMLNEAIGAYSQALKIQPTHISALTHLAAAFLSMGDKSKAISVYETALRYYPDELSIHYYLSGLASKYLNSELQDKVEAALSSENEIPSTISNALFLKAKFAHQNCDYVLEMELLSQAHAKFLETKNFQKGTQYYLNELQHYADKKPSTFDKEGIAKVSRKELSPIFIVGAPRSGSTLIENIICAADKEIKKGEETSVIDNEMFKFLKLDKAEKNYQELGQSVLTRYEEKKLLSSTRFTDKSLENIFMVGFILDLFPKARIIYCKRNPISSVISILQYNLGALSWAHNLDVFCKYLENCSTAIKYWKTEYPESVYEIDYDLLVTNQVDESKKLLEFCELLWSEDCLHFYKKKGLVSKTASVSQIRNPIHSDSVNKFKQYELFFSSYKEAHAWLNE